MKLNVSERVTLLSCLPEQGDFVTLKIVRKLREALAFDEDEISRMNVKQDDGRITWNPAADEGKDVVVGEKAHDIVSDCLRKLDQEKKLTAQHCSLYELFVVGGQAG